MTSLSPVELSALEHLTSELLRTLSRVAASKPTSWLSMHSNIVSHLASTLGPSLAVWAVSLSTLKFIPQQLTPGVHVIGLRSLPEVGNLVGPLIQTVLYGQYAIYPRLYLNIFRREPDITELD